MRLVYLTVLVLGLCLPVPMSIGGTILSLGQRWDADQRTFSGHERSLDGGLRYSASGGSYDAFRNQFSWQSVPSSAAFQSAVEGAFSAWTSVDPVSGFGTSLQFHADFATPIVSGGSFGSLRLAGAEIDLIASDAGNSILAGLTSVLAFGTPVTLTSGVQNYAQSTTIQAVDLHLNNNASAIYTLGVFQRLLTHEIGHAIGLGDVDLGGAFLDDNFDVLNPVPTLNNSWAAIIDPLDPANSIGVQTYSIAPSVFGLTGVDLLMESNGLGIGPGNPLGTAIPLTNDEYATRQYLYPSVSSVPEPNALVATVLFAGLLYRRHRQVTV